MNRFFLKISSLQLIFTVGFIIRSSYDSLSHLFTATRPCVSFSHSFTATRPRVSLSHLFIISFFFIISSFKETLLFSLPFHYCLIFFISFYLFVIIRNKEIISRGCWKVLTLILFLKSH